MKYGDVTLGQVEAIINKLGGMDGVKGLLSGALVVIKAAADKTLSIWKSVAVSGATKDELFARLANAGVSVSDLAKDVMSKSAFTTSAEPSEVRFSRATPRELGFTKSPTTIELFARVKELGYQFCQPEDGPWLALQDIDRGDWLWLIMEPITDSDGYPRAFDIGRSGRGHRWLDAGYAVPDDEWDLDERIVFRSGK